MPNTILIIEDSDLLRRTLQWWLEEEFPGSRVNAAGNSVEAGRLAQSDPPDVIIIDTGPARTAGLEVVDLARTVTPSTPIIVFANVELGSQFPSPLTDRDNIYLFRKEAMLIQLQSTLAAFLPSSRPTAQERKQPRGRAWQNQAASVTTLRKTFS